jgi:hypothetical protein
MRQKIFCHTRTPGKPILESGIASNLALTPLDFAAAAAMNYPMMEPHDVFSNGAFIKRPTTTSFIAEGATRLLIASSISGYSYMDIFFNHRITLN